MHLMNDEGVEKASRRRLGPSGTLQTPELAVSLNCFLMPVPLRFAAKQSIAERR